MKLQSYILFMIAGLVTSATVATKNETALQPENVDNEPAESSAILSTIEAIKPAIQAVTNQDPTQDLGTFPYEPPRQNLYDTFPSPQTSFGIALNSQAILKPKVELLYLVESFLNLFTDALNTFQRTFNDNYDLFRAIVNFTISKISYFKSFALTFVTFIRKALQFLLAIFSDLSITLPSITFGAQQGSLEQPHFTYGIPPSIVSNATFKS